MILSARCHKWSKSGLESLSTFSISKKKPQVSLPIQKKEGILPNYVHRSRAGKWTEIGKEATEMKNTKGCFPPGAWSHTLFFRLICLGCHPRKLSFSGIKTTSLLMAPPGRGGHIPNPEDGLIVKLLCFWLFGFLSEVIKKSFLVL